MSKQQTLAAVWIERYREELLSSPPGERDGAEWALVDNPFLLPLLERILSSPDYVVVKRRAAERALEAAHTAGMGQALGRDYADDLLLQARTLLGLSDQEPT